MAVVNVKAYCKKRYVSKMHIFYVLSIGVESWCSILISTPVFLQDHTVCPRIVHNSVWNMSVSTGD